MFANSVQTFIYTHPKKNPVLYWNHVKKCVAKGDNKLNDMIHTVESWYSEEKWENGM
jgi:hypothetical protein